MLRSVVITGLGPVTAFGVGIDPLWNAMIAGRPAIDHIRAFDPSGFVCQVAAELPADALNVRDIVPKSYRKATKVMCRDVELAVGAALAAVSNAGIFTKAVDPDATPTYRPERFGCHIGAGLIAADVEELTAALVTSRASDSSFDLAHWGQSGMQNLTPLWLLKYLPNMLACHVTIVHGCEGPSNTITCCEASSALSLGESMRAIEREGADICLTGGAEYKLNPMAFIRQQFAQRLAHADGNVDPKSVARPFDPEATGTVIGEGGGLLIVEAEDTARQRGANICAKLTAFAATQSFCPDAVGVTIPADDESLGDSIQHALAQGELNADEIDAIVPLGSSIPSVDQAESAAIRRVFGDRAASIPLNTTVPFFGNCMAGNGAIALSVAAKCLMEQKLPARLNTQNADGVDANACDAREANLRNILVFTTSQGGQNAAVILSREDAKS